LVSELVVLDLIYSPTVDDEQVIKKQTASH
jgi:hypothetical protein